jgi:penicillin-binding protein 1A
VSPGVLAGLAIAALIGAGAVCIVYRNRASTFDLRQVANLSERSAVYDMDGRFYALLAGENRVVVPLEAVSPYFVNALLAREDSRFFKHHGIDPMGIARAELRNLAHGHIREGGSTLTQQLALNTFLGGRHVRSLNRKLLEAFLAIRIERKFTKRQILECYVNRIYFGLGVYGIEAASQAYFNEHAKDLTLSQAAMLVALIRSPVRYSPFRHPRRALAERNEVLDRMVELKMMPEARSEQAKGESLRLAQKPPHARENYATGAVRREVRALLNKSQIKQRRLQVYTTIDPQLQGAAEAAVDSQLRHIEQWPGYAHPTRAQYAGRSLDAEPATPYLQAAVVMIDNRTGGVRALVGGRNYRESTYDRALYSKRQIGSTFKPFVYAAAFSRGLDPSTLIDDQPIRPGELVTAANWQPENSDAKYLGMTPAAEGLIQSRNTMTVRVGDYAGIESIRQMAKAAGLGDIPSRPSIYLGAFEATLRDVTAAYTIFPNEGVRRHPYIVERIEDGEGHVLYRAAHVSAPALSPCLTDEMTTMLQGVMEHGTGSAAWALGWRRPAAGKTGTTNHCKDAWFVGYTRSLTCGVWVGFDHPQQITQTAYGSALALPIWVAAMKATPPERYPAPDLGGGWPFQTCVTGR